MKPLNLPEKGQADTKKWEYTTLMSIKILSFMAAAFVAIGLLVIIGFIFFGRKGTDITIPLLASISIMISSVPLYVLYHVADDIHYMSFITEKQENEKSETTFSFFDDVNRHLIQQTQLLEEIANMQNSILKSMDIVSEDDNTPPDE